MFECHADAYSAVDGNIMRLSLLRGPCSPDPDCDVGQHDLSIAIYPHAGTYTESDVADVAYAFNNPLHCQSQSAPLLILSSPRHGSANGSSCHCIVVSFPD